MGTTTDLDAQTRLKWAIPSPSWESVAVAQKRVDEISTKVLALPIAELRALGYRPAPLPAGVPEPGKNIDISTVEITVRDGATVPLRIYKPTVTKPDALLFFNAHGGGWVLGVPETEEAQNRLIAVQNKAVVVSVDYRKAPEFPYPIPLQDCYDAFQWSQKNASSLGINANKIILGGGSAGANLVAALALQLLAAGNKSIVGQILNIPVTCHPDYFPTDKYPNQSYEQNATSPIVDAFKMNWFWGQYLSASGVEAASSPHVSPLLASKEALEGLPPTLVQVAGLDPLRDEGLAYAEALKASGVQVTEKIHPGLPHAFYIHPNLPETAEYFQVMVDWIEKTVN